MSNMTSCCFIQNLFRINLWFLNFVINNEVKFFRCLFTIMIKYMTCVTITFDLSLNSWMSLSFNNCWNVICKFSQIFRVIAKRREGRREDFFFNFPSLMGKGKFYWGISLFACEKGRDFFEFPFPHVKRKEIFLNFPSHMKKNQKKMNFYLLKWAKSVIFCEKGRNSFLTSHCGKFFWGISLPACEKERDCLLIFLLNDHSANFSHELFINKSMFCAISV